MNELQRSQGTSDGNIPGVENEDQMDGKMNEKDPETWYGLVWRIVRTAIESNGNLIRVCILICLVGGALWLIAHVVRLGNAAMASHPRSGGKVRQAQATVTASRYRNHRAAPSASSTAGTPKGRS
jgi:hypothetical protein